MKQTKQFLINLFTVWKRPIYFFGICFASLICIFLILNNKILESIVFCLFAFSVLTIIFSVIYQLIKRQFLKSFLTLCVLGIGFVIFYFFSIVLFWKIQSTPDEYADELIIPQNIKINIPSDTNFSIKNQVQFPNFQLYHSGQLGIYKYTIWTKNIEKGVCFLKAFEVTQNDPLSVDRLKENSKIEIYNPTDSIAIFSMLPTSNNVERDFVIYEGDWGKPYAARFEVWFVPANGGKERKLMEKNFKIEGWMR